MKRMLFYLLNFIIFIGVVGCAEKPKIEANFDKQNKEIYVKLLEDKKFDELQTHLELWEKEEPKNPEVYIAYFNYYRQKGRSTAISFDKYSKGDGLFEYKSSKKEFILRGDVKDSVEVIDPDTNKIVGYINEVVKYNLDDVDKALKYIEKGIAIAPDRLDIHFGKIYMLNEIADFEKAGDWLLSVLNLSKKIDNKWFWKDYEKIKDAEEYMLATAQGYNRLWIDVNSDESLKQLKRCSFEQIKLYPKSVYAYNNLATYHIIKEEDREALEYLLEGEKVSPNDCIVLENIATTYLLLNEKEKADEYIEKASLLCKDKNIGLTK